MIARMIPRAGVLGLAAAIAGCASVPPRNEPDLANAFEAKKAELLDCYGKTYGKDATVIPGTTIFILDIAGDGSVRHARLDTFTYKRPKLENCFLGVAQGLRFPARADGGSRFGKFTLDLQRWTKPAAIAEASQRSLTFFNVSDAHVGEPAGANGWRLAKDALPIFRDTLARVDAEKPAFVLLSGDTVEGHGRGLRNLELAYDALATLRAPYYIVSGNHDRRYDQGETTTTDTFTREDFLKKFRGHGPSFGQADWTREIEEQRVKIIGLNSADEHTGEGKLSARQLSWLDQEIRGAGDGDLVLVVMHHPAVFFHPPASFPADRALANPPTDGTRSLFTSLLRNAREFRAVLEKWSARRRILVLAGHTHAPGFARVGGVAYLNTPSINSWPNRYARIKVQGEHIHWDYVDIADKAAIAEAWAGLVRENPFRAELKTDADLRAYFSDGATSGDFDFGAAGAGATTQ